MNESEMQIVIPVIKNKMIYKNLLVLEMALVDGSGDLFSIEDDDYHDLINEVRQMKNECSPQQAAGYQQGASP